MFNAHVADYKKLTSRTDMGERKPQTLIVYISDFNRRQILSEIR